jgi:hypothetical protein
MIDVIERKALLEEIEKVYNDHYAQAYDQTIHDLFNAVCRRIRRAPAVRAVDAAQYKKLLETAEILDSAVRVYQQKYGDLDE